MRRSSTCGASRRVEHIQPKRDPHSEADIAQYVEIEAQGQSVKHVEKVKEEVVLGEVYEIWDVTTDKERWWVISNMTNLYSQRYGLHPKNERRS
jgi:hypothetical protein